MEIVKIDRGSIVIAIEGHLLQLSGEAMLPREAPLRSEYVVYKDSLCWQDTGNHPIIDKEDLFLLLEKEFLKRNLKLIIQ